MDFPPLMDVLGFIPPALKRTHCICQLKCIYGNVDSALYLYIKYATYLMHVMGLQWSLCDPCLFYCKDSQGNLIILASCHVDVTLIAGRKSDIDSFKTEVRACFNIKDMGSLLCHLGIWHNWSVDPSGDPIIEATMNDLIEEIVDITKKVLGKTLDVQVIPARPHQILEGSSETAYNPADYR